MFKLHSEYEPQGDQPQAIEKLVNEFSSGKRFLTLLGVTGSGKTFTMANVISKLQKPALVISHNKTLAAQLYNELKHFFPENAVEYFISYYDYYQPEAYIPQTDTYIEKDASINTEIERLRLSATSSLLSRPDVIVVASVSCIYGLGSREDYEEMMVRIEKGEQKSRSDFLRGLVDIQYERNDFRFEKGTFRVRGDTVEVYPAYGTNAYRVELFGDQIESVNEIDPLTGNVKNMLKGLTIYPAKHFVSPYRKLEAAFKAIEEELQERLAYFRSQGKLLEAQRLESRTHFDMEMLREIGYCQGIENYSRHLSGRKAGERPTCLLDFFPKDYLIFIDESHVMLPQIRGMYQGDRSRKTTLVEYGFRLPSALDNRPLRFDEFEQIVPQTLFVSATPGPYELAKYPYPVEQVIRPTGLVDPEITVKPLAHQVDDLIEEIQKRVKKKERILVTTLTKKMSEDLTDYLKELGIRVRYLHSEIDALERVNILRSLRKADFDVLVGINLLREGLDLPEVSLVAVLDADKEGFLRSQTSLIQVAGRAARHISGEVIFYADVLTDSIKRTLEETHRRRQIQKDYNEKHKITPKGIQRALDESLSSYQEAKTFLKHVANKDDVAYAKDELIYELEGEMRQAAEKMEFEQAAMIRDKIYQIKKTVVRREG
ncbi:MAG: excinuclease ABC subunit UvrB [Chlamydiae bacterium]|nr:excinuclease ABC subunit UvrB [Chlamydiota bacterium]MBI3266923.1 excinuclease ABC subunit UvrB [Chlamydiota bacterium]